MVKINTVISDIILWLKNSEQRSMDKDNILYGINQYNVA